MGNLPKCEDVFTKGECDGHIGKFDSCVAEALHLSGWADETTGTGDFEGHYALHILEQPEGFDLSASGHDGTQLVVIPTGNYVVHESGTGQVSLWRYDTPAEAQAEFEAANDRYADWLGEE